MRKLQDLSGDEFFDLIGMLSPLLSVIGELEIVQMQAGGDNDRIAVARSVIKSEMTKKAPNAKTIKAADAEISAETAAIIARDAAKIIPIIVREHRDIAYGLISIVDEAPVSEVKKYPGPKIMTKIAQIVKDTDFGSFLSYAEPSERKE